MGATFDKVENPGGFSSFYFCPVFASVEQGGQYKAHGIPFDCQSIPPNEDNNAISTQGGWIFPPRVE